MPSNIFTKSFATAKLLCRVAADARTQSGLLTDNENSNSWDAELTISGLSDARRIELVEALLRINNLAGPARLVGDGLLHLSARTTPGFSLAVNALAVIGDFGDQLRRAGLDTTEILDSTVTITLQPVNPPHPGPRRTARRGRRLSALSYGLTLAGGDLWDMSARQHHGDSTFSVTGGLCGLGDTEHAVAEQIRKFGTGGIVKDGKVAMTITAERVGGGIGALLLVLRNMAPVLAAADAQSTLRLSAAPSEG